MSANLPCTVIRESAWTRSAGSSPLKKNDLPHSLVDFFGTDCFSWSRNRSLSVATLIASPALSWFQVDFRECYSIKLGKVSEHDFVSWSCTMAVGKCGYSKRQQRLRGFVWSKSFQIFRDPQSNCLVHGQQGLPVWRLLIITVIVDCTLTVKQVDPRGCNRANTGTVGVESFGERPLLRPFVSWSKSLEDEYSVVETAKFSPYK